MDIQCSRRKPLTARASCNKTIADKIKEKLKERIINCNVNNEKGICRSGNDNIEIKTLSCGVSGITFVSEINGLPFILKIQDIAEISKQISIDLEIQILRKVSIFSIANPFFVNYYSDYVSDDKNFNRLKVECKKFSRKEEYRKYKVLMIEKFDGDINSMLSNKLFYNLEYIQQAIIVTKILLSIYSFHMFTKSYHNDTHHGNFLFVKNSPLHQRQYTKFNFDGKHYILPVGEYDISICDYGIVKKMSDNLNILCSPYILQHRQIPEPDITPICYEYLLIIHLIINDGVINIPNFAKSDVFKLLHKIRFTIIKHNSVHVTERINFGNNPNVILNRAKLMMTEIIQKNLNFIFSPFHASQPSPLNNKGQTIETKNKSLSIPLLNKVSYHLQPYTYQMKQNHTSRNNTQNRFQSHPKKVSLIRPRKK